MMREYKLTEEIDEASDSLMEALFGEAPIAFEEYDFTKSPLENSRASRNNMLISLIQQRLMDEDTFEQRYTPGGFAKASRAARIMRELEFGDPANYVRDGKIDFDLLDQQASIKEADPEPNYDPTDIMTIITYNQQNQVAGKLIGIFANQNTNHALASLMKTFALKEPISFCGHSYSDLLHPPTGIDTESNLAEWLSASVDAVKDPVPNFVGLNTITADAGALLSRLGYTATEMGLLFRQPIIKDICEYSFNNGVPVEIALRQVVDDYKNIAAKGGANLNSPKSQDTLSKESLAWMIYEDRTSREKGGDMRQNSSFSANQLVVAELFNSILKASGDVTRFVTTSKFTASNAVGSTFGDLYAQQMRVDKYIEDNKSNSLAFVAQVSDMISGTIHSPSSERLSDEQYLISLMDNPFGYEQAMYDMNVRVRNLLTKYFPYDTSAYKDSREFIATLTKSETLDADTINDIHRDMLVYMLSQREGSLFNGDQPVRIDGVEMTAREYYTKVLPNRLYNILEQNPELKSYMIFNPQYMVFSTDETTGTISMNVQNIGGLESYQKDALRESWSELDKNYPNVARDLFIYNFYKLGFTFSPLAFMNLAPSSLKLKISVGRDNTGKDITYIDFLKSVLSDRIKISPEEFAKQFILNHLDNRKLAYYPTGESLKFAKSLYISQGVVQREFTLDISALGESAKNWTLRTIGSKENKEVVFKPCIVFKDGIYMAVGEGSMFNSSKTGVMRYVKVNKLGTSNVSMAYHSLAEDIKDYVPITTELFGSTKIEPENGGDGVTFDRSSIIDILAPQIYEGWKAANFRDEQGELYSLNSIKEMLNNAGDEYLKNLVEAIKVACRKDGILVFNSKGELLENC